MTDIRKASQDAIDAARQSDQFALILATIQATQAVQQPVPQPAPAQHAPAGSAGKWIAIGVGGSVLLLTVAISAVAVALAAISLAICALVIHWIIKDIRKG